MRKILLPAILAFIFYGCETKTSTTETRKTETTTSTEDDVEIGAGTEISPQLEGVQDSATRLKVDTISSAEEAREAK